jgi:hypothetical protein
LGLQIEVKNVFSHRQFKIFADKENPLSGTRALLLNNFAAAVFYRERAGQARFITRGSQISCDTAGRRGGSSFLSASFAPLRFYWFRFNRRGAKDAEKMRIDEDSSR